jgi:glycosyltransferase involved in cell wall biosynthesis
LIRVASLVSYKIVPAKTGGQRAITLLLGYLSQRVPLTCYSTSDNEPGEGITFELIPFFGSSRLRYINPLNYFRLRKEIRRTGATHILLEHPYWGWLGILLQASTRARLVVRSHNIESLRFRSMGRWWWRILKWYERYTHRCAALNFFITEEDRQYALKHFGLKPEKCAVITYGTVQTTAPSVEARRAAKAEVCRRHNLDPEQPLFFYNGTLDYPPNRHGLDLIIEKISPALTTKGIAHTVLISGSKLPPAYQEKLQQGNVRYTGFVPDIETYFMAADVFMNPVMGGGGIKTKLVEALAAGTSSVSFKDGAFGIPSGICGDQLKIVDDGDTGAFTEAIVTLLQQDDRLMPQRFYDHFSWVAIAQKATELLQSTL